MHHSWLKSLLFFIWLVSCVDPKISWAFQSSAKDQIDRSLVAGTQKSSQLSSRSVSFDEPLAFEEIPRRSSRGELFSNPQTVQSGLPKKSLSIGPSNQIIGSNQESVAESNVDFPNEVSLLSDFEVTTQFESCCSCGFESLFDPCRYEFFFGSQSFSGPLNYQGASPRFALGGSHGLSEGLNWAGPMPWIFCGLFTGQVGLRATQNNFYGSPIFDDRRDQLFVTAGLFRRVDYGLQGGLVFDALREDWYIKTDLSQLRGELSFALC